MQPPHEPPVLGAAARDVAGAEREIGAVLDRRDQPRHVGRVVREVAVHLQHELRAAREHVPEPVDVGASQSLLARPVEHLDPRQLGREPVGDLARAVG